MDFTSLTYGVSDGVATVTLNRPDALNALTPEMLVEIRQAVEEAGSDDDVGVIVLTGAGRAFSAGVDLKALGDVTVDGGSVGSILDQPARALIESIQASPRAVIAKVNGFCFTGALEIALACDIIVASAEAKLGDTHAKWGLRPTWGMSARLPRAVGIHKAKELSFTAAMISGAEAAEIGLVNRAVPAEELDEAVQRLAEEVLANSRDSIAAYKRLYRDGMATDLAGALQLEFGSEFEIGDTGERLGGFLRK